MGTRKNIATNIDADPPACKRSAKVLSGVKELRPTATKAAKNSVQKLCDTICRAAAAIDKIDLDFTAMERVRTIAYLRLGAHLLTLRTAISSGWRKRGEKLVGSSKFQRAVDIACYFEDEEPDEGFKTTLTDLLVLIVKDKSENPSKYPWQQKKKPERAKAAAAGKTKPKGKASAITEPAAKKPIVGRMYLQRATGDFVRAIECGEDDVVQVQPLDCFYNPQGDPIIVQFHELEGPVTVRKDPSGGDDAETYDDDAPDDDEEADEIDRATAKFEAALATILDWVVDDPFEVLWEVIHALGLKIADVAAWAQRQAELWADDEPIEATPPALVVADEAVGQAEPVLTHLEGEQPVTPNDDPAAMENAPRDETKPPTPEETAADQANGQVADTLTPAAEVNVANSRDQQQQIHDEARAPVDAAKHVESCGETAKSSAAASNNGDEESDEIKLLPPEKRRAFVGDRISFKKEVWEVIAELGYGGTITLQNAAGKQANIHSRRWARNGNERYRILDKPRPEGEDLASMVVKALTGVDGGLDLADLTEKVLRLGYKTNSDNLGQAIYNVLGALKKRGKVVRDNEAKKYILVSEVKYEEVIG